LRKGKNHYGWGPRKVAIGRKRGGGKEIKP